MKPEKIDRIFVVQEQDDEGETWIESVWFLEPLAKGQAAKLEFNNKSTTLVTEMAWDDHRFCFRVPVDDQ